MKYHGWLPAAVLMSALLALGLAGCSDNTTAASESAAENSTETEADASVTETDDGTPTESPTETEPVSTVPEEMTMEPTETIAVIADGKTSYTVIPGDGAADACRAELDWLYAVMDEKYGTHPTEADSASGSGGVITLSLEGNSHDWSVSVDAETGNIALRGGSAAALGQAVRYVGTQFCGAADGSLTVPVNGSHTYTYETDKIDNSGYLTYEGRGTAAPSDAEGKLLSPVWLDTAIMVEVRLDTASIGGTFRDSYDLIDFYAEAGVNVIWLDPIYQRGPGGNGYGNVGLHTVEPALTGTQDMAEGWAIVKDFVEYAHSKGVYILLDIVSWGTMKGAPLVTEHPEWFDGESWGNAAFNWNCDEFREWFIAQAVYNIEYTGADGYRCDCEPFTAGYDVYAEIRSRLNQKGIYPLIMSEDGGERQNAFDCEQDGVLDYTSMTRGQLYQQTQANFYVDGYLSMVSSVQKGRGLGSAAQQNKRRTAGTYRYYTNCITNHDYENRSVCGNRLKIGYAAIYAPFIPVWYMGDEFGVSDKNAVLYNVTVDYSQIETNPEQGLFFEDVKRMIAIRRAYPDIFNYFPLSHRDSNICKVTVNGFTDKKTDNYARYMGDRMVIVVANNKEEQTGVCTVEIPFSDGFTQQYYNYRVTDLLTGRVVAVGRADTVNNFAAVVPHEYCGVFLVEGIDPISE